MRNRQVGYLFKKLKCDSIKIKQIICSGKNNYFLPTATKLLKNPEENKKHISL